MSHKAALDMDQVYRMYKIEDLSYREIADKFSVTPSTIGKRLKAYALERGMQWPLKTAFEARAGGNQDSVSATLIVGEIQDCIREYRISQSDLAQACGLTANHLHQITGGFKPRILRATAEKILWGIQRVEKGLVEWDKTQVRLPMAIRDTCDNGHRYTGRRDKDGRRVCLFCRADKDRRDRDARYWQEQERAMGKSA